MKQKRKPKPPPPTLTPQPSWNLGRHIRVTLTGQPVPEFIRHMIVKQTKGA